jgi:hypothetical protein
MFSIFKFLQKNIFNTKPSPHLPKKPGPEGNYRFLIIGFYARDISFTDSNFKPVAPGRAIIPMFHHSIIPIGA